MGKKKKSTGGIVTGHIDSDLIYQTHREIKTIVDAFANINVEVANITNTIKDNWVGKGRNEFEAQYKLLIKKIDDFGDTLTEIYEGLVDAEYQYEDVDDSIRQQYVMSMKDE